MKGKLLLSFLLLSVLGGVQSYAKKTMPGAVIITITCKGDRNSCYSYTENGKSITVGGDAEDVEIDGNVIGACPSTGVASGSVFIYDLNSPTNGRGFVGIQSCLDPANRTGQLLVQPSTPVYTSLSDWMNAAAIH